MASPIAKSLKLWSRHKASSYAVARSCERAAHPMPPSIERERLVIATHRIRTCNRHLKVWPAQVPGEPTRLIIKCPYDCKHPLCQSSARLKSVRMRKKLHRIIDRARADNPGSPLIMLTLTAKNRPWAELPAMLDDLAAAWLRFLQGSNIKRAFTGAIAAFEIVCRGTPDKPEAGAHLHAIVMAHRDYFDRTVSPGRYLSQASLTTLYQSALRAPYKPIVHVTRIADHALSSAIRECGKYVVKPAELFTKTTAGLEADPAVIRVLAASLYRRKMLRLSGTFAAASRALSKTMEADD